jgi:hypothetical protein
MRSRNDLRVVPRPSSRSLDAVDGAERLAAFLARLEVLGEGVDRHGAAARAAPEVEHDVAGEVEQDDAALVGGVEQAETLVLALDLRQIDGHRPGLGLRGAVTRQAQAEGAEHVHEEAGAVAAAALIAPAVGAVEVAEGLVVERAARERAHGGDGAAVGQRLALHQAGAGADERAAAGGGDEQAAVGDAQVAGLGADGEVAGDADARAVDDGAQVGRGERR